MCVFVCERERETERWRGESRRWREWHWRESEGEVWRDGVGDGREEGGAAWGMGERNITVCCWSQGVTMVTGERDGRDGERERESGYTHLHIMQIDSFTDWLNNMISIKSPFNLNLPSCSFWGEREERRKLQTDEGERERLSELSGDEEMWSPTWEWSNLETQLWLFLRRGDGHTEHPERRQSLIYNMFVRRLWEFEAV